MPASRPPNTIIISKHLLFISSPICRAIHHGHVRFRSLRNYPSPPGCTWHPILHRPRPSETPNCCSRLPLTSLTRDTKHFASPPQIAFLLVALSNLSPSLSLSSNSTPHPPNLTISSHPPYLARCFLPCIVCRVPSASLSPSFTA